MKKLFTAARAMAAEDVTNSLADFRQKRDLGTTSWCFFTGCSQLPVLLAHTSFALCYHDPPKGMPHRVIMAATLKKMMNTFEWCYVVRDQFIR